MQLDYSVHYNGLLKCERLILDRMKNEQKGLQAKSKVNASWIQCIKVNK